MQLVLNTFGSLLGKSGDCFEIKAGDDKRLVAASKVSSILITTGAVLSTDSIELAIAHNIDLLLLDKGGHPYARIWQCKLGSATKILRLQLEASESELGLQLGRNGWPPRSPTRWTFSRNWRARGPARPRQWHSM